MHENNVIHTAKGLFAFAVILQLNMVNLFAA